MNTLMLFGVEWIPIGILWLLWTCSFKAQAQSASAAAQSPTSLDCWQVRVLSANYKLDPAGRGANTHLKFDAQGNLYQVGSTDLGSAQSALVFSKFPTPYPSCVSAVDEAKSITIAAPNIEGSVNDVPVPITQN